ncbi:hypothetical protein [Corynebacterium lactis]|uniref:Tetratricopeptide repeat protein n=1 Tax=Corynebacterium lactis RW2-5 TaxID=1408189 RepID=A0A0K2H3Q3_9CORY|nr:hypothetical protein [Corynebacterium lactis]ALA68578.1 hypothetical protein CLAC_07635 [Corynebacterium lactis RW2-5]
MDSSRPDATPANPADQPATTAGSPQELFDAAHSLAADDALWEAALHLMQGFEKLGDKADAPQTDSLGRPIRGSAPKLMDKAADWLELLDNLEKDGVEPKEGTPPRHLRWAMWHTLSGQAEIRRGHQGRAIDHLELAAGLFQSESLNSQAVALLAQIAECHLDLGDVGRAEDALFRAQPLADDTTRARYGDALGQISAEIARRLRA